MYLSKNPAYDPKAMEGMPAGVQLVGKKWEDDPCDGASCRWSTRTQGVRSGQLETETDTVILSSVAGAYVELMTEGQSSLNT
jgi:hypothetical protein